MDLDRSFPVAGGRVYLQHRVGTPGLIRSVTLDNGTPAVLLPCGLCSKPLFFAFAEENLNDDGTSTVDLSVACHHQKHD